MPFTDFEPERLPDRCMDTGHDPPSMIVLEPGTYTWKCPSCGKTTTFVVRGHYLQCGMEAADAFR